MGLLIWPFDLPWYYPAAWAAHAASAEEPQEGSPTPRLPGPSPDPTPISRAAGAE